LGVLPKITGKRIWLKTKAVTIIIPIPIPII